MTLSARRDDPMVIVERVLQILDEGTASSTYKYAVLLAMLDLCVESADKHGDPPVALTTRQLAKKVIELYWKQTRTWIGNGPNYLDQGGELIPRIQRFRERLERQGNTVPVVRASSQAPREFEDLLRFVEWKLIEMPLPKLQRIRRQNHTWLYVINWDDGAQAPTRGEVGRYQRGEPSNFDNQVRLQAGVGHALSRLHVVLRPFIQTHWATKVAQKNGLEQSQLAEFLFGANRSNLEPVRAALLELQRGRCFYCQESISSANAEVDHFLPWSRHPEDGLANLVAADKGCNKAKLDYLASHDLLAHWRCRMVDQDLPLRELSRDLQWDYGDARILGAARAVYLPLPEETLVWAGGKQLVTIDKDRVRAALA